MRNLKTLLSTLLLTVVIISCSDTTKEEIIQQPTESKSIKNLHAPGEGRGNYTGPFTKFSFSKGKQVTDDNWDIAFRATEIIINGGEKGAVLEDINRTYNAALALKEGTFTSVKEAPELNEFKQDSKEKLALLTGSGLGWYTYNPTNHSILPTAGKVLVIKTHNGHYAKMEIVSYYKDLQVTPTTSQYYTFNYVYNPNKGDKNLQ